MISLKTQYIFLGKIQNVNITVKREISSDLYLTGNKYRKLKHNLIEFYKKRYDGIVTFGGPFSNHLAATSSLCEHFGIKCFGFVRGDEMNKKSNPTIEHCINRGMQLEYLNREDYKLKLFSKKVKNFLSKRNLYLIPEGGANDFGIVGSTEMIGSFDHTFDTICLAVGTGGTIVGVSRSLNKDQKLLGFLSVNDSSRSDYISNCINSSVNYELINEFNFGGFGKFNNELIIFINSFKKKYKIPLDPIYTGKVLFGIFTLINNHNWRWGKNILFIHTGGLQGIDGFNFLQEKKSGLLLK